MEKSNEQIIRELASLIKVPEFDGRNIPATRAAKIMGKNLNAIYIGLQRGILPIGYAIPNNTGSGFTYYISPKMLYEVTGYVCTDDDFKEVG